MMDYTIFRRRREELGLSLYTSAAADDICDV